MDLTAIALSLRLAACTTAILLIISAPIACWLAFGRSRSRILVEAIVALPLVLPPTVLGFYLLLALGPRSAPGRWYESLTGSTIPFTFTGLLIASILYSLPFAVQPLASGFAAVDRRLIEASWCLGVSRTGTFFRLIAPLSSRSILTAAVLAFAHTLGEFGVVLMIGGNIPGKTRTASISVYDAVAAMDYARANQTSLFLLAICLVALVITYSLRRGTLPT